MFTTKDNIVIFTPISCIQKPFNFSLTVQIKVNRCMASYAMLDFPVILQSSGSGVGRIIIRNARDDQGYRGNSCHHFLRVGGKVGLL